MRGLLVLLASIVLLFVLGSSARAENTNPTPPLKTPPPGLVWMYVTGPGWTYVEKASAPTIRDNPWIGFVGQATASSPSSCPNGRCPLVRP